MVGRNQTSYTFEELKWHACHFILSKWQSFTDLNGALRAISNLQWSKTARYWRWLTLEFDENPNIEAGSCLNIHLLLDDDNDLNLYDCYEHEIIQYPEGEQDKRLDDLLQSEDTLESDGFYIQTTELWIYGPYSIREQA